MNLQISRDTAYKEWLFNLKQQIRVAQLKAAVKVNTELLNLYWNLGKEIVTKQQNSNWGDALIEQLAKDLSSEFPDMKGFSRTNLFYIRRWFLFYSKESEKVPQPVGQLQEQPGSFELIPQLVVQIPWGHNREIITKAKTVEEAIFYVQQTIINNWSRNILQAQMESGLFRRKGKVLDNFESTLPKPQADLARETLKNPYNFDFLVLGPEAREKDLEDALLNQIQKFLLELGQGFAFMGRQYIVNVGGDDFRIDLLFYHTRLRCYVVVELKVTEFEPEFAGKLNFYLSAIDAQLRHEQDQPTIGILLCKTPNTVVVEYSLQSISKPLGVAEYQLTSAIPEDLKGELPTIEELEEQLTIEVSKSAVEQKLDKFKELVSKLDHPEMTQEKTQAIVQDLFTGTLQALMDKIKLLLKDVLPLFADSWIAPMINESANRWFMNTDLEAHFIKDSTTMSIGIYVCLDGFKKGGTNTFSVHETLTLWLDKYKYHIGQQMTEKWHQGLYGYKCSEEDIIAIAERFVEIIIDRVTSVLETQFPKSF